MTIRSIVVAASVLLAGCDNFRFTADLATDPPSNPEITSVEVNLRGLDFRRDDGTDATLEFSNAEVVNLLDLQTGDPLRLFTDEELPVGRYIGVRLLFDEDQDPNRVTTGDSEFPLLLADDAFAAVDFSVREDEGDSEALSLLLDLRPSLSFDGVDDDYTLTPRLRAVRTNEIAQIEGTVSIDCLEDGSLATIGAVYLFLGRNIEPDDLDGVGIEPFATTRITAPAAGGFQYALRFLPAGDYTLAFTCRGDQDTLGLDDDLDFSNIQDFRLAEDETLRRDLN